jgi:hypothetical protein
VPEEVPVVVGVDVAPGERPPDDDAIVPVVLHERDLARPGHASDRVRSASVRLFGALGVVEHHEREVKAVWVHRG